MNNSTLMIQGTTSDAGKSILVTALCRWLVNHGISTAPFKPQNMSLNSAVTSDGGEIGRAQAVQAQACRIAPHTDMNPILLKPNSDVGAQVIVQGHAISNMNAQEYHHYKEIAHNAVFQSYQRLAACYQTVIVEGAGSPAEINLRHHDIANMGFAEKSNCPVILVADIDRGGVFAQIVGTLDLLTASERERIIGFVINKFRGDMKLLESGLQWLEERTGKPVLGVLPYLYGLHIDAEDALPIDHHDQQYHHRALHVAVPVTPRISNHTDLDPLRRHPQVKLTLVGPDDPIPDCDLIILPGSKNVCTDLQWLRQQGWEQAILRHLRYGGKIIGICGGFQMLGKRIHDPLGIESEAVSINGLGVLDIETTLSAEKELRSVNGRLSIQGSPVSGYEIHAGRTCGSALARPAVHLEARTDGAISQDGLVLGTYLHGLFETPEACAELLSWAGLIQPVKIDYPAMREGSIDKLANTLATHLNTDAIAQVLGLDRLMKDTSRL